MNGQDLTLAELHARQYTTILVHGEDGFEAWHPEFGRGTTMGLGDTPEEALSELNSIRRSVLEIFHEQGMPIPQPATDDRSYSGQLVLRMPQSLHRSLALSAKQEGTSLNQYLVHLLSVQEERAALLRALKEKTTASSPTDTTSEATDNDVTQPARKSA